LRQTFKTQGCGRLANSEVRSFDESFGVTND